jgi:hypothetical protein
LGQKGHASQEVKKGAYKAQLNPSWGWWVVVRVPRAKRPLATGTGVENKSSWAVGGEDDRKDPEKAWQPQGWEKRRRRKMRKKRKEEGGPAHGNHTKRVWVTASGFCLCGWHQFPRILGTGWPREVLAAS